MAVLLKTIKLYDDGNTEVIDHRPVPKKPKTNNPPQPVEIDGKSYKSLLEASKMTGWSRYIILTRLDHADYPTWRRL